MTGPLARGAVTLRLYPHLDRPAAAVVDELLAQGELAAQAGWDGVMTSEHHGGFAGYVPNPLQLAGWLLDAMPVGWAAPCPILLPLRPAALVAEEVAWLAARRPGRVGVGVAAGGLPTDFALLGVPHDDLAARFARGLAELAALLRGDDGGNGLGGDPAIAACASSPVPVASAVNSATAARRAARAGVGLLVDSLTTVARCRELVDVYRGAGGTGTVTLVRRAWLGAAPTDALDAQVGVYAGYASAGAQRHWGADEVASSPHADVVVERLVDAARAAGADAMNLRVAVPGVAPEAVRDQVVALGAAVVPRLRAALGG